MNILGVFQVQNDFCKGGLLEHKGSDSMIEEINKISKDYDIVLNIKDYHPIEHISFAANHPWRKPWQNFNGIILWPIHCIAGTYGAENPDSLIIRENFNDLWIGADSMDIVTNIFEKQELKDLKISSIAFCGTNFIPTIFNSAIGAIEKGINVNIIKRLCLTIEELKHLEKEKLSEIEFKGAKIL
ncbi:MAG: hypothetical protein RJA52_116 [Bacteroidota bacterium]|jgi:nicotinamidase/pyrazinamidase